MGTYKEEHGTTLLGDILRKGKDLGKVIAPEILRAAGTITGLNGLKKLGDALDKDSSISPEEKEQFMEIAKARIERDIAEAEEVSKRWASDMSSDSWLSKNIRPLTLGWLILFTSAMILSDSINKWDFELNPSHTLLLQTLLVTVVVAYFSSRGVEKFNKIRADWKKNK